jgi:hypothetical protein
MSPCDDRAGTVELQTSSVLMDDVPGSPQGWNEAPDAMMVRVITSMIRSEITRMGKRLAQEAQCCQRAILGLIVLACPGCGDGVFPGPGQVVLPAYFSLFFIIPMKKFKFFVDTLR